MNIRRDNGMRVRLEEDFGKRKRSRGDVVGTEDDKDDEGDGDDGSDDESFPNQEGTPFDRPVNGTPGVATVAPPISFEEQARQTQRSQEMAMESSANLVSRKRRRRIRGFGSQPADPGGLPPRHGSEISLCESKVILELSNDMYRHVREAMHSTFDAMNIERKVSCPPGLWDSAKNKICARYQHLGDVFTDPSRGGGADFSTKNFAFEAIAHNVLKIMRNSDKVITVAKAGVALGLNPLESSRARKEWYAILQKYNFTTKDMCSKDRWKRMQRDWFDGNELLLKVEREGLDAYKKKCLDKLIKGSTSRYRENLRKADPSKVNYCDKDLPGPGPLRSGMGAGLTRKKRGTMVNGNDIEQAMNDPIDFTQEENAPVQPQPAFTGEDAEFVAQLEALEEDINAITRSAPGYYPANTASVNEQAHSDQFALMDNTYDHHHTSNPNPYGYNTAPGASRPIENNFNNSHSHPQTPNNPHNDPNASRPNFDPPHALPTFAAPTQPIPAYFRLSPTSKQHFPSHPKIWLGKLRARTVEALYGEAAAKVQGARVQQVCGVVKEVSVQTGEEEETEYLIDELEELEAYLEQALEGKGKAVFVVRLTGV